MDTPLRRRPRESLALELVEALAERIRRGDWSAGDRLPDRASVMSSSASAAPSCARRSRCRPRVSSRRAMASAPSCWTAWRARRSKLSADQLGALQDVIAVLELRIGLETEAAALAALRRTDANLATMRQALDTIAATLQTGENAVASDFQFHSEIARATQNAHFYDLMLTLGSQIIPGARLSVDAAEAPTGSIAACRPEHSIYDAIAAGEIPKRPCGHAHAPEQQPQNAAAARRPAGGAGPPTAGPQSALPASAAWLVAGPSELCVSDWADQTDQLAVRSGGCTMTYNKFVHRPSTGWPPSPFFQAPRCRPRAPNKSSQSGLSVLPSHGFDAALNFAPKRMLSAFEWLQPYGASALPATGGTGEFFSLEPAEFSSRDPGGAGRRRGRTPHLGWRWRRHPARHPRYAQEAERLGAQACCCCPTT